VAGRTCAHLFALLRSETEVGMNRSVIALAASVFVFAFILLAYGLYELVGNLSIYAACAAIVVGMFVYLVDALTSKPPQ
jgi:hypothetical protein